MSKKIYIACPANVATGGPELLHQLCHKLRKKGYISYMYYYGRKSANPVHERYEKYKTQFVDYIEDNKNNIIIVPEVNINLLKKFKNIKKSIWWLSVDNYFISKNSKRNKIKTIFGLLNFDYREKDIIHLSQSQYAIEFLKDSGIKEKNIYYLSDYLNSIFIEESKNNTKFEKKNNVLYNPKKGYEFTKKIIDRSKDLNWVPLENLKPEEMSNLMMESKVYIDFGNHPGKDRIPREAAISGCCIITGKRGSAKYKDDVYIEDEFKFNDSEENIDSIISKINYLIENYENETKKFDLYRDRISKEEIVFEKDIDKIFTKII